MRQLVTSWIGGATTWQAMLLCVAVAVAGCSDGPSGSSRATAQVDAVADVAVLPDVESDVTPLDIEEVDIAKDVSTSTANCSSSGCTCKYNADCDTGLCIEVAGKLECASLCQTDCKPGFVCTQVSGPNADLVSVCTPAFNRLCEPCQADLDCSSVVGGAANRCVPYKDNTGSLLGNFCAAPCGAGDTCPSDYTCASVTSVGGQSGKQCVRSDQQCTCDERAVQLGLATVCSQSNALGSCAGKRSCGATGLSACDAPMAQTETCNQVDDNCNGQTDEGGPSVCKDDESCTYDNCVSGECQHPAKTGPCDDGSACTNGDACSDGKCKASPIVCEDGDVCTVDGCDPLTGCVVLSTAATCTDGNACTTGDACSGGACLPSGVTACDDSNPCTSDACDPQLGCVFVNNTVSCDDGDVCTVADTCSGGSCSKVKALSCQDGNPCTIDGCDPAQGCTFVASTAACDDGNGCTVGDVCAGGVCLPGAATNCDDQNPCTTDVCDLAVGCTHTDNALACSDGNVCTQGDTCGAGGCQPGPVAPCNDQNPCTDDSCDPGLGCQYAANSAPCSDGNTCTEGDACASGSCKTGSILNCDDGNDCTSDFCDAQLGCLHNNNAASCTDGSVCTGGDVCKDGACQPGSFINCSDGNPCTNDTCDPAAGCVFENNKAPCNDFNGCTTGDICSDGVCQPGAGCGANAMCAPNGAGGVACMCVPGYVGDGQTCVGGCGDGVKAAGEVCDDGNLTPGDGCSPACAIELGWTCSGAPKSVCCPPGQYAQGGVCLVCDASCTTCDSATNCTACPPGKVLQSGVCAALCPAGTVAQDGQCKACPVGCDACSAPETCKACVQGKILFGGKCYDACPAGTFQLGDQCIVCNAQCATCSDAGTCTSCPPGKALSGGQCIDCKPKVCGVACGEIADGCGGTLQCGSCGKADVAGGNGFTCGLLTNGRVKCWGVNDNGQLGDGSLTSRWQASTTTGEQGLVVDVQGATQITAGANHACALLSDKTVRCWGSHAYGQLGDGSAASTTPRVKPVTVAGLASVASISAGRLHTCALLTDGTAKCWGYNGTGQLGDGTTLQRVAPVGVANLNNVNMIGSGYAHTCALIAGGTVKCWGYNLNGQIGDGTLVQRVLPTGVLNLTTAASIGIAGQGSFSCAVLTDGTAKCWGANVAGQLGDGTVTDRTSPVVVSGLAGATAIGAGVQHTCAHLTDGTMRCWGRNSEGQLGDTTTTLRTKPVVVAGLAGVTDIGIGQYHSCALVADNAIRCWGYNIDGQLGDETNLTAKSSLPVVGFPCGGTGTSKGCGGCVPTTCQAAGATSGVIDDGCGGTLLCGATKPRVAGGSGFTCSTLPDGTVRCWGINDKGQLGDGTTQTRYQSTAVVGNLAPVKGIKTAIAVTAGQHHACALLASGQVQCWGSNAYGQLGASGATDVVPHVEPMTVTGISTAVALSAGRLHNCAVLADGSVKCWGYNASGQVGDGTTLQRPQPVTVGGVANIVDVKGGYSHTCALTQTGLARCWGENVNGQLGNGTTPSIIPRNVAYLTGVTGLGVGSMATTSCAVVADGTVRCWGDNANGQVGDTTLVDRTLPTATFGLQKVVALTGGTQHQCARLTDGTAQCWGRNSEGQLGDTTLTLRKSPVVVAGLTGVEDIGGGQYHSCAHLKDGTLRCWGYNNAGQLGNETTITLAAPGVVVHMPCGGGGTSSTCGACVPTTCQAAGVSSGSLPDGCGGTLFCGKAPSKLVGGTYFGCTIVADGSAQCWGRNNLGQLGNGVAVDSLVPVKVSNLKGLTSLSAGNAHACATTSDGLVWCWGSNSNGQLGTGNAADTIAHPTPLQVAGITTAVRVSAGRVHSCALLADGTVKCWGNNASGQLGDGSTLQRLAPVAVVGIAGLVDVTTHYAHTCALTQTGLVKCWGDNALGQLGNGTTNALTPVNVAALQGGATLAPGPMAQHTCVVQSGGSMACWGDNASGQIGDNTSATRVLPTAVANLKNVASVASGYLHTCAVLTDGTGKCWGRNTEGQLGDTTTTTRLMPTTVATLTDAVGVGAQYYASCFLLSSGGVKCTGYNGYGGLGTKSTTSVSTVTPVSGLP